MREGGTGRDAHSVTGEIPPPETRHPGFALVPLAALPKCAHLHQGIFFVCRPSTRYLLVVGGAGAAAGHVSWGLGIGVLGWPSCQPKTDTPRPLPAQQHFNWTPVVHAMCIAAASHDYGVRGVAYMRALVAEQQQNMFDHHQLIRARGNFSRSRPSPLLSPALCVCGQYGVVTTMRAQDSEDTHLMRACDNKYIRVPM